MAEARGRRSGAWMGWCLAGCAALLSLHQIGTFDYWTHLALGRALWEAGAVRIGEPLLAHALGQPMDSHGWPFQGLLYAVYSAGGHGAVCAFVAAAAGATFGLLWRLAAPDPDAARRAAAWGLAALTAYAARPRFTPRTEVLAYLLAAAALVLAHGWARSPGWRRLGALGAVLAAWSQLHLSWAAGAGLALAPLALSPRIDFWRAQWRLGALRRAGVVGAGLLAGALLLGASRQLGGVLGALRGGDLAAITEMQPLWRFPSLAVPFGAAAAGALALAWGEPEGRLRRCLLWALAVGLGLVAARNVALALLGTLAPALVARGRGPQWGLRIPVPLLAGGVGVALVVASALDRDPPWGVGVRWELFPRDAAAFVRSAGLPGPVLNTLDVGGYLGWAWAGQPPTFIDGRVFGHSPQFQDLDAWAAGEDPGGVLARRGTRTAVLRALYYSSGRLLPVLPWLLAQPEWALVRATDALVFARRPLPEGVAELPPAEAWRYVLWEAEVKAAEGGSPPHLGYTRGVALLRLGNRESARDELARAAQAHPLWRPYYEPYLRSAGLVAPGR